MFNDDEDEVPGVVDPEVDAELTETHADEEPDAPAATVKPRKRPAAKRAAARKAGRPAAKAAPAKPAANASKKAAPAAKKKAAKKGRAATPPADLTGVRAGAHTLWVSKDLGRALTSKDRRKLKAILKRADKRRKSKKR